MTAKINKQTNDTTVYIYDIENKLVQVQKPGMIAQYVYDALGRRMSKTVNGNSTHYRYDGENLILEMNGNDSVVADYTFGAGIDKPLQISRNGQNYYYHSDGLGSIRTLTDDGGNVVQSYNYSVFGKIVEQTGSLENPFTYTGREYDKETGNYYYRKRYYDAGNGRFLSEDPAGFIGGDYNLYRFVDNDPVDWLDPYGLKKKKEKYDGYSKENGSKSWRDNNPGNIIDSKWAKEHGAIGCDANSKFAKFKTEADGLKALKDLLNSNYSDKQILDAINKYAPPSENDPAQYIKLLDEFGIDTSKTVGENNLDSLAAAIKKVEGWKTGDSSTDTTK